MIFFYYLFSFYLGRYIYFESVFENLLDKYGWQLISDNLKSWIRLNAHNTVGVSGRVQ